MCLEKVLGQLRVILYTQYIIYPSVHNQLSRTKYFSLPFLSRTLFEAHIVLNNFTQVKGL